VPILSECSLKFCRYSHNFISYFCDRSHHNNDQGRLWSFKADRKVLDDEAVFRDANINYFQRKEHNAQFLFTFTTRWTIGCAPARPVTSEVVFPIQRQWHENYRFFTLVVDFAGQELFEKRVVTHPALWPIVVLDVIVAPLIEWN
jgi:hypothetical protein